jgi:hypothetical protein
MMTGMSREAVHEGHHDVEHDQVGERLARLLQRLLAVDGGDALVPLHLDGVRECHEDVGFVVAHQNFLGHRRVPPLLCLPGCLPGCS